MDRNLAGAGLKKGPDEARKDRCGPGNGRDGLENGPFGLQKGNSRRFAS